MGSYRSSKATVPAISARAAGGSVRAGRRFDPSCSASIKTSSYSSAFSIRAEQHCLLMCPLTTNSSKAIETETLVTYWSSPHLKACGRGGIKDHSGAWADSPAGLQSPRVLNALKRVGISVFSETCMMSQNSQFQNVTDRNLLTNQTVNQCSVCFIIVLLYIFIITIWLGRLSTLTVMVYESELCIDRLRLQHTLTFTPLLRF